MTAEECIERITDVLSRRSTATIVSNGTDLLDRLMDISSIVKEYYKKGYKAK